jgi:hypothetical protein
MLLPERAEGVAHGTRDLMRRLMRRVRAIGEPRRAALAKPLEPFVAHAFANTGGSTDIAETLTRRAM